MHDEDGTLTPKILGMIDSHDLFLGDIYFFSRCGNIVSINEDITTIMRWTIWTMAAFSRG
jgi:hypothetical protein